MNIPVHEHLMTLWRFYGVLINFHEIMMKLQIFKFYVSDVIPMNVQNI